MATIHQERGFGPKFFGTFHAALTWRSIPPPICRNERVMIPAIEGSEHLTASRLLEEIPRGGRFTMYTTCVSILVGTIRRPTRIQYLAPRDSHLASGFRHVWPTFLMGWWGLPWGPIHTIESILNYLHGGTDLTEAVLTHAEHMFQDGFGTPEELANLKHLGKQMGLRRV